MIHRLSEDHKEHLRLLGIAEVPSHLDIPDETYEEHAAAWRVTLPHASEDVIHEKVLGLHATKNPPAQVAIPAPPTAIHISVDHRKELRLLIAVLAVIALLLLFSGKAHAQFSKINSITAQNNDNSQQGFFASPFTFKAGANCAFSVSGSTATFNCSGGAAGAGGSNSQIQWNSTGSLAGISTLTTDGTIVTQKIGTNFLFADPSDTSKKIQFDASGVTTATTRTVTFPDANSRTIKNGSSTGQIPIWNAGTSTFDVSDPLVQGTTAEGAAIPNPVVIGGKDGSGNNKALVLDSSGRPTVNVNGTVAVSGTVTTTPPSNASTNVAQLAGTTTDTNSGVKSGGTLRVVIATDQPALSNKLLVTPDSVALPANQSVNVSQVGATSVVANPCETAIPTQVAISQTANTKVISATSAKKNYICSMVLIAGAAEIVSIEEGTGSTCGTGTAALVGSTTTANGMSFAVNGGVSAIGGKAAVISGITANVDTCIFQNGSNRVSGWLTYVQQ